MLLKHPSRSRKHYSFYIKTVHTFSFNIQSFYKVIEHMDLPDDTVNTDISRVNRNFGRSKFNHVCHRNQFIMPTLYKFKNKYIRQKPGDVLDCLSKNIKRKKKVPVIIHFTSSTRLKHINYL